MSDIDRIGELRTLAIGQLATLFIRSFAGKVIIASLAVSFAAILLVAADVVEPGTAADWAAAGGAIFAAAAALNIAGNDRAERREERLTADLAQMRLVRIDAREWRDSSTPGVQLKVTITNYGQRPILQALLVAAEVESQSAGTFKLADPTPVQVLQIVPTVLQPSLPGDQTLDAAMKNESDEPWIPQIDPKHRAMYANGLNVKVECVDADGQHWLLSNQDEPHRNLPKLGASSWRRLWTHRRQAAAELCVIFAPSQRTQTGLLATGIVIVAATIAYVVIQLCHWLSILI